MREELEQKLLDEFPFMEITTLWGGKRKGIPVPCECGDGWYNLIYDCCKEIDKLYKRRNKDINKIQIYQIKEKYGGLRIYLGNYIEGTDEIVNKYEDESMKVCEICGGQGKLKNKGYWLKTLCDKHGEELGFRDRERVIKNG